MKRPPEAPVFRTGQMTQADFDAISREVTESLALARARQAAAAATAAEVRGGGADAAWLPIGAENPQSPATNRGGKSGNGSSEGIEVAARLVLEDGKVMEIPARRGYGGDTAFLDWVNFTAPEDEFFKGFDVPLSDSDVIRLVSLKCFEIFGFGITSERETGANFYHRSYILGEGCGLVCHGGQRATVLVMLSGEGCAAARPGWEKRLYDFLSNCGHRAHLTRVDFAHDVYDGKAYNVDKADLDYDVGLFNCGGRNPNHEYRGNWKRPNGKGRTLYIGNRKNGKFCRVYEKGKQLGDASSSWVRVEVEMKSIQRIIPLDALLRPGEYLAAAYPAFGWISEHQERILTVQKKTEITYASMVAWVKRQCGAALNVLAEIEGSAEAALGKVIRRGEIPARLKASSWLYTDQEYVHEEPRIQPHREVFDAMAFA